MQIDQKFFVYVDGYPSENLINGGEERWHTSAFIWIPNRSKYSELVRNMKSRLPNGSFRKWSTGKSNEKYRKKFVKAFADLITYSAVPINIVSFQEKSLRTAKEFLVKMTEIDFQPISDTKGRRRGMHGAVGFEGYKPYVLLENEALPVMALAWLAMNQRDFYFDLWKKTTQTFCTFELLCDLIDGDTPDNHPKVETLRYIIHRFYQECEFVVNFADEKHSAMYLADNFAGLCGQTMESPNEELAQCLCKIPNIESFVNWSELVPSSKELIQQNMWPRIRTGYQDNS